MNTPNVKMSPEFKNQSVKVVISILLFIFVYLILVLFAIALTAFCIGAGVIAFLVFPKLIGIFLGLGIAIFGILILVFVLKFLFKSHKVDSSQMIELKKADEPKLFQMLEELANEVETSIPDKVFISNDVSASVAVHSSFVNLFTPIKKDLIIGLGLVNVVTKDELRAILAHEFGHFSQKTLRLGSYIYQVNKIIFNMLFENEGYGKLIQHLNDIGGIFTFFTNMAVKVVQAIQWVLMKMYDLVNKQYFALSREMEFNADEIAAKITGYLPLKNGLLKLDFANMALQSVFNFYLYNIEKVRSENVYKDHEYAMQFLSEEYDVPIENGLPKISWENLNKFNKSRLVIDDQWASHPSLKDRTTKLKANAELLGELESSRSDEIFTNINELQKRVTLKTFVDVDKSVKSKIYSFEEFKKTYTEDYLNNSFDKIYNKYYNPKNIVPFDLESIADEKTELSLTQLYSDEKTNLIFEYSDLYADITTISHIANKNIDLRTFDYDGKKYKQKDAKKLLVDLDEKLTSLNNEIVKNDIEIYKYFNDLEKKKGNSGKLHSIYTEFFDYDLEFDKRMNLHNQILFSLNFIETELPYSEIKENFKEIKIHEDELKTIISKLLSQQKFQNYISESMKVNFEKYLSSDLEYFGNVLYFEKNLNILYQALNDFQYLLDRGYFILKKALLKYQVSLME